MISTYREKSILVVRKRALNVKTMEEFPRELSFLGRREVSSVGLVAIVDRCRAHNRLRDGDVALRVAKTDHDGAIGIRVPRASERRGGRDAALSQSNGRRFSRRHLVTRTVCIGGRQRED